MGKSFASLSDSGYFTFPYIIIREMTGMYRQIPIHFVLESWRQREGVFIEVSNTNSYEEIESNCISFLLRILNNDSILIRSSQNVVEYNFNQDFNKEGCVVFAPNTAVYINNNLEVMDSQTIPIPSGGLLLSVDGSIIREGNKHYNFGCYE